MLVTLALCSPKAWRLSWRHSHFLTLDANRAIRCSRWHGTIFNFPCSLQSAASSSSGELDDAAGRGLIVIEQALHADLIWAMIRHELGANAQTFRTSVQCYSTAVCWASDVIFLNANKKLTCTRSAPLHHHRSFPSFPSSQRRACLLYICIPHIFVLLRWPWMPFSGGTRQDDLYSALNGLVSSPAIWNTAWNVHRFIPEMHCMDIIVRRRHVNHDWCDLRGL